MAKKIEVKVESIEGPIQVPEELRKAWQKVSLVKVDEKKKIVTFECDIPRE